MRHLINTLIFSFRLAIKAPMNTILCISVLAGGIALATSMFRLYEMVFATNVPYKNAERMTQIERVNDQQNRRFDWPFESYKALKSSQTFFEDMFAFVPEGVTLKNGDAGSLSTSVYIDSGFEKTLGIQLMLGRSFVAEDSRPDSTRVTVISYALWKRMFNSAPDVLGKTLVVDGVPRTIVGVMPESIDGPFPMSNVELWLPLNLDTLTQETGWVNFVYVLGVVRADISHDIALEQAITITKQIAQAYPGENEHIESARLSYVNDSHTDDTGLIMLTSLFVCTMLILLMACGIASGLVTARYSSRAQELAIRSALGATRLQIIGQMFIEFTVISTCSVVLGYLLSRWFDLAILNSFYDQFGIPAFMRNTDNTLMTIFIIAVLCLVTLASTIMPALRASKTDLSSVLRESTRTGSSLRVTKLSNVLITWQVATACIVLCGGAIMGYLLYDTQNGKDTYDSTQYHVARIAFNAHDHNDRFAKCREVVRLLEELRRNPQIEKVCMTTELFGGNQWGNNTQVWIDGKDYPSDNDAPQSLNRIVSPGYFDALDIPILSGRDFRNEDTENPTDVIVTEDFARKYYGSTDVLGKRFRRVKDGPYLSIVGVVPEVFNPKRNPQLQSGFFIPYASEPWDDVFLFIKGRGTAEEIHKSVTDTLNSIDNKICVAAFGTLDAARGNYGGSNFLKFMFTLFVTFSIGALIMAASGLYGVISFSTNMRRTEMGIRLALGANPSGLVFLMAKRGLFFVALGLVVGAIGTLVLRHFMQSRITAMPESPWAYLFAVSILLTVATTSVLIPSFLGSRIEPSKALRED